MRWENHKTELSRSRRRDSASVFSATANSLSVQVPAGATSGTISVTVTGNTATSTGSFTVLQVPVVTSISPKAIDGSLPPPTIAELQMIYSATEQPIRRAVPKLYQNPES